APPRRPDQPLPGRAPAPERGRRLPPPVHADRARLRRARTRRRTRAVGGDVPAAVGLRAGRGGRGRPDPTAQRHRSRSLLLRILPPGARGSASTNTTDFGILYPAILPRRKRSSSDSP